MKDPKTIFIVILFILFGIFFSLWYFKGSPDKNNTKDLQNQIKTIQKERDSLTERDDSLKLAYKRLNFEYTQKDSVINKLNSEIQQNIVEINNNKNKLFYYEQQLASNESKIDSLRRSPTKRTGKNLLNSLQNKTK